ncbi:hypothetical protein FA95DRAFT_1655005 [Auriscalpium vulgare]|uniref:Uncharacterized protein n=1 Tax=Auriscalpium vulgare TaxID=40419 RepID=A0ACB8R759_9AGAM|nr:hypothetical protein FA95DRAFT_1655005 [Auriscalpium vulgare]
MFRGVRVLLNRAGYEFPLSPTVEAIEVLAVTARDFLALSQPMPALRHICFIVPILWPSTAVCAHLVSTGVLAQLHSVQIRGEFPPAEILAELAELRTLVVDELPRTPVALPRGLQHVGYQASRDELPGACAVAPLRALPALRLVTVTRRVERQVRAALEGLCWDKGIEFGVYPGPEYVQAR